MPYDDEDYTRENSSPTVDQNLFILSGELTSISGGRTTRYGSSYTLVRVTSNMGYFDRSAMWKETKQSYEVSIWGNLQKHPGLVVGTRITIQGRLNSAESGDKHFTNLTAEKIAVTHQCSKPHQDDEVPF